MGRKFWTRQGIGKQSAETVPCGLDQQEESISTLGEDLADDEKKRPLPSDFENDIHTMISVLTSMPHGRNLLTKRILRFIYQRRKPKINVVCVLSFSGVSIHFAQIIGSHVRRRSKESYI